MDHNAFLTLNGLWYVCSDEDYRAIAHTHDYDEAITLPEQDARGVCGFHGKCALWMSAGFLKRIPVQI
jgi:hypothetical protein